MEPAAQDRILRSGVRSISPAQKPCRRSVGYAVESMSGRERNYRMSALVRDISWLTIQWHASRTEFLQAATRILSCFQPYAAASRLDPNDDWLFQRRYLPFDPRSDRYNALLYMAAVWGVTLNLQMARRTALLHAGVSTSRKVRAFTKSGVSVVKVAAEVPSLPRRRSARRADASQTASVPGVNDLDTTMDEVHNVACSHCGARGSRYRSDLRIKMRDRLPAIAPISCNLGI